MATADEISALYQQDFGRAPDQAGLDYWANSGLSADQLNSAFANSGEYSSAHAAPVAPAIDAAPTLGGSSPPAPAAPTASVPSNSGPVDASGNYVLNGSGYDPSNPAGFIQSLYQNDYGRPGDQSGVDFYTSQLQNGASPDAIAKAFLTSGEFQQLHPQAYAGLNPETNVGAFTGDGIWFDNSQRKNPDGTPWNGDVGSRYYGLPGATGPGGAAMGPPLQKGTQADPNKDLRDQLAALQAELAQLQGQLASMTPGAGTTGGTYQPRQGAWIPGQGNYIDGNGNGAPSDIPPNYLLGSAALFNMGHMGQYGVPTPGAVSPTNMYPSQAQTPYVPAQVPHIQTPYGTSAPYASPIQGPNNPMMPPIPLAA